MKIQVTGRKGKRSVWTDFVKIKLKLLQNIHFPLVDPRFDFDNVLPFNTQGPPYAELVHATPGDWLSPVWRVHPCL